MNNKFFCVDANEVISLWREPAPVITEGEYSSVILDRGELKKAVPDSKNEYIPSEKGAGTKPIVLVGTYLQIIDFLKKKIKKSSGVISMV